MEDIRLKENIVILTYIFNYFEINTVANEPQLFSEAKLKL